MVELQIFLDIIFHNNINNDIMSVNRTIRYIPMVIDFNHYNFNNRWNVY